MFKQNEKTEAKRCFLKCDCMRFSPAEISTINTVNSQKYIEITRENSVISLLFSYLDLNFDVLQAATGNRYADSNDMKLVILGPIGLFSIYKLTASWRKHREDISHAHIISVLYELLTSAIGSDDLSIGFDRCRDSRENDLLINKNIKGKLILEFFFGIFSVLLNTNKKLFTVWDFK